MIRKTRRWMLYWETLGDQLFNLNQIGFSSFPLTAYLSVSNILEPLSPSLTPDVSSHEMCTYKSPSQFFISEAHSHNDHLKPVYRVWSGNSIMLRLWAQSSTGQKGSPQFCKRTFVEFLKFLPLSGVNLICCQEVRLVSIKFAFKA